MSEKLTESITFKCTYEEKRDLEAISKSEGKTLSDFYEIINKRIEEKLLSDFSIGTKTLDINLQTYIESVIKNT